VVQLPQGNAHFRKFMHNDTDRHENNHVITEERKDNVSLYVNHRNKTFDLSSPDVLEDQPTSTADDRNRDSILFVDDNIELLHYMQLSFSEEYNIIIRKSAEEALTYLKNNTCNIVVSDVMMEGMDGTELCKRIKENADISWIPVILLTAKSGKDFVVEGLQYGADDYITKPFDTDILKSKIRSILDNRKRLSKYYLNRSIEMASQVRDRTSSSSLKSIEADDETTSEPQLNIEEKAFVEKATQIVLDHLSDENFDINKLCREMTMSRTLFYGKIKALTSESPQKFIQSLRLEQAAALLKQGYSVLDVSTMAGFVNVKYFSTVFKKYFGVSPSKYKLSFENK
jgi:DNA-binding response OmpR family regulator